jgi:phosphonatase-like hydrolase
VTAFRLACLDMAGTTVGDDRLVERAFTIAMVRRGMLPHTPAFGQALTVVRDTMGQSKIEVFRRLTGDETAAREANATFEEAYADLVREGAVRPLPGAVSTLRALRAAGVRTALTTGFSKSTQDTIVDALGWRTLVDAIVCPQGTVRGRPYPDMVLAAARACGVTDLATVVVVGDTPSDVESGVAAGAGLVAGVLTGAGEREALLAAGADVVFDTVEALVEFL